MKTQYRIMTATPATELIGHFIQSNSRSHGLSDCAFVFKTYTFHCVPVGTMTKQVNQTLPRSKKQKSASDKKCAHTTGEKV